ncbi:putative membrane protein [Pseudomonas fluorescens]|uniref:Putative membrane protein n=1 Tax=Pseudomonas fluorescens TaxID=294 RepID=A0A0P8XXA0_PSEFL|nr:hypothetical protein [Pseudomonas fluorescens]KPU62066.1 putative membrane protein [Pseudomonas fluorescens]
MSYLLLKFIHLTAAAFFIGGVFFEVMILSPAAHQLDQTPREQLSKALGVRARRVMHWVVLALFGAGLGLAWLGLAVSSGAARSFGQQLWHLAGAENRPGPEYSRTIQLCGLPDTNGAHDGAEITADPP